MAGVHSSRLRLRPISLRQANHFVAALHPHHGPVRGHKFAIAVEDATGVVRGVAIAGRPVARMLGNGWRIEVLRVASDGTPDVCSMLYGSVARAGVAIGYRREDIFTYTSATETGASLRAAGWVPRCENRRRVLGSAHATTRRPQDHLRQGSLARSSAAGRIIGPGRPMRGLAKRFEAKVDRSGEHHVWTGSKRADGTGQLKVNGRPVPAKRVAWELVHGPLPEGAEVLACPKEKACVKVEHLSLRSPEVQPADRRRASPGDGRFVEVRPGVWKLTLTRGQYEDGHIRRIYRTIEADNETEARRLKAQIIADVEASPLPARRDDRDVTLTEAVKRHLERLQVDKGREERTIRGYRQIHEQWFAPEVGERRLRDLVDEAVWDRLFGRMRQAGLSRSRMNQAKSLYQPLLRRAKRDGIIPRNPMADFELPKSQQVPSERQPPEVEQLCLYLAAAVEVIPDVAPILTLGATTGMRRGELVVPRRDQLNVRRHELTVDIAADVEGVKAPKNNKTRTVTLDDDSVAMLQRHIERMDERAAQCGIEIAPDAYIFSLEPDCSKPIPADYVTKRVAVLKEHLGISDKRPATIALEDEALALFRADRQPRERGRRGPQPKGALSYADIGRRLNRSGRWAALAIASAERREVAQGLGEVDVFDGSILGLRKFTSSELLDAGFNISAVAQRQGHGPQVLARHYGKRRRSADRRAAEHLGRLVHGRPSGEVDGPSL